LKFIFNKLSHGDRWESFWKDENTKELLYNTIELMNPWFCFLNPLQQPEVNDSFINIVLLE